MPVFIVGILNRTCDKKTSLGTASLAAFRGDEMRQTRDFEATIKVINYWLLLNLPRFPAKALVRFENGVKEVFVEV